MIGEGGFALRWSFFLTRMLCVHEESESRLERLPIAARSSVVMTLQP